MNLKRIKEKWLPILLTLTVSSTLIPTMHDTTVYATCENVSNTSRYNASDWKQVTFGQTTDTGYNSITEDDANKTVMLTAGTADGKHTGGKITNSHDGISYYYTSVDSSKNFVLSADVKVNFFAKPKADRQEGFGIMARDAIGQDKNPDAFPSNMVLVGGYGGMIQSVFRNNVVDSTGAGATMEDVTKFGNRPANDGTVTYKLMMKKNNTGYVVSVNNGTEKIYYRPKQLQIRDKDHIYVGFFVARVASIAVSNIKFTTSNVATDPAGKPEPEKPKPAVIPSIGMTSASSTGDSNYNFNLYGNVKGKVDVKQNGSEIYNGALNSNGTFSKSTTLSLGANTFDVVYTPDKNQNITSAVPVISKYVVTYKVYGTQNDAIYVSPYGILNAKGTQDDPVDIASAISYLGTKQKIYLRGGTYNIKGALSINKNNSGTYANPKIMAAYKDEKPVLNFTKSGGFSIAADYWKISGIDVMNTVAAGFRISGNHNVIYKVNTYNNGDTGMQISGDSNDKIDKWPSYNLILDCTSHDNLDSSQNNADGFAAKLTCGVGNVFRGCISHNNCDDGYDLFSKLELGPIGAVTVENCIAYGNGTLSDGTVTMGDGNGFKMGGEGLPVKHILRNCLSFNNNSDGVTSNYDPAVTFENCTSIDNGKLNFNFLHFNSAQSQFSSKNNISLRTATAAPDSVPTANLSDDSYYYNGTNSENKSGQKLLASDFKSVIAPKSFTRNADGSIAAYDFMTFVSNLKIRGGANLSDFSNITDVEGTPGIPDKVVLPVNPILPVVNPVTPIISVITPENNTSSSKTNTIVYAGDARRVKTSSIRSKVQVVKYSSNKSFLASDKTSSRDDIMAEKIASSISEDILKRGIPDTLKMVGEPFDINLSINSGKVDSLTAPVTTKISINADDLKGVNINNLTLYYFNKNTNKWEFMSDALYDSNSSEVTVTISKLGTFAIMEKVTKRTGASVSKKSNKKNKQSIKKSPKENHVVVGTKNALIGLCVIAVAACGVIVVLIKKKEA